MAPSLDYASQNRRGAESPWKLSLRSNWFLLLLIGLWWLGPRINDQNKDDPFASYANVVLLVGINVILATSLQLINGLSGQFSLGHAGFMALGLLRRRLRHRSLLRSIPRRSLQRSLRQSRRGGVVLPGAARLSADRGVVVVGHLCAAPCQRPHAGSRFAGHSSGWSWWSGLSPTCALPTPSARIGGWRGTGSSPGLDVYMA